MLRKKRAKLLHFIQIQTGIERFFWAADAAEGFDDHHDLFERGVARAFADTVKAAFDLPGGAVKNTVD